MKYIIWLVENYTLSQPQSVSTEGAIGQVACRSDARFKEDFHSGLYLTLTIEVLWMDSMTAARRLHRSWAWLTWTLGGSLRTTVSADPSRTRGRNSPSFTCNESVNKGRAVEMGVYFSGILVQCLLVLVSVYVPILLLYEHTAEDACICL